MFGQELLADFGDIGLLAAEDEKLARLDLGALLISFEQAGFPYAGFDFFLHLIEKRLELLEVLARRPGGDLFRCLDFHARPDVFQDRQAIGRRNVDAQFRQQFVVALRFMRLILGLAAQQAESVVRREKGVKFRSAHASGLGGRRKVVRK